MEPAIRVEHVNHYYGSGSAKRQILFDITTDIHAGEIVILTGPSGSGKTTLLTLIGALRSAQEGSLKVLGHELRGASEKTLVQVRKQVGYIFQAHNLLDSLDATQNVRLSLQLHPDLPRTALRQRPGAMLEAVGLGDRSGHHPDQLSGGQKQRVAIARALASEPKLILADEPTASLDKKSGRDVVELMQKLAKQQQCTVVLVTHDNRILDIADRIINLEDGRLTSFTSAVISNTQHMVSMLTQNNRKGDLERQVRAASMPEFRGMLDQITAEAHQFIEVFNLSESVALESMLDQVIEAFTLKVGQLLSADRVTLFLVDKAAGELWSKVAKGEGEARLEIRTPLDAGIAGRVATTGQSMNIVDAYQEPLFNPAVDQRTGYHTRTILTVPLVDSHQHVFAVVQLLNKVGGAAFDETDEQRLAEFANPIAVILETWSRLRHRS